MIKLDIYNLVNEDNEIIGICISNTEEYEKLKEEEKNKLKGNGSLIYMRETKLNYTKIDIIGFTKKRKKKKKIINISIWNNGQLITDLNDGILKLKEKTYKERKDRNASGNFYTIISRRKIFKKIINFLKNTGINYDFEYLKNNFK